MILENEKYESVREKLRKLQALAEQGVGGEVEAAKAGIKRICERYGITPEELVDFQDMEKKERYNFDVGRTNLMRELFTACVCKVLNVKSFSYWNVGRAIVRMELTKAQYIELNELYNWHRGNMERERDEQLKLLLHAYIHKHRLFSNIAASDETEKELTKEDVAFLQKILHTEATLEDRTYYKQLESK